MNKSFIKIKSSWGHVIFNMLISQSIKSDSIVVIFPGGGYSCDKPLLHYARKVTSLSGCDVLSLEYGYFKTNNSFNYQFINNIIEESYEAIKLVLLNSYKNIYFISKSFGTEIAGEISRRLGYDKVNNLFLTPTPNCFTHIENSKCIVVVGTKDSVISKEQILRIGTNHLVDLHVIDGAVHSLEVEDNYIKSLDILRKISILYEKFVSNN
ncbi:alpha/beta hydrolase [Clostridium sp.]|uniref:alpha/beta hydrolase n=1 Tax=Clostridium sp. TaxID=1506 RepID=UPI002628D604|nr:alpha/beta hydrolase [uncultured Clostridium sp.]